MTTLTRPVAYRFFVTTSGTVLRKKRIDALAIYGCPYTTPAFFWRDGRNRYVVALRTETRKYSRRWVGCYHVLPTRDAATLFALAAGGG